MATMKPVHIMTDLSQGTNQHLQPVIHPTLRVEDIFNRIRDCKIFSKLDMKRGYHHVNLAPESHCLSAFITPSHGLLQYCRAPMELADSGAAFQIAMDRIL